MLFWLTTEKNWKKAKSTWTLLGNRKKTMEHESDDYTNCNWCSWYSYQRICKGTEEHGNKKTSENHPNYDIIKDIEKNPGDLLSLKIQWKTIGWRWCEKLSKEKDNKLLDYYYYYCCCCCYFLRAFYTSVTWLSFTGIWMTASLPKYQGLFSVFCLILTMLWSGWSCLCLPISNSSNLLIKSFRSVPSDLITIFINVTFKFF